MTDSTSRSRAPTPEEVELWRTAMRGAKPFRPPEPVPPPAPLPAPPPAPPPMAARPPPRRASPPAAAPVKPGPPPLEIGASAGIDRRTHERLSRGQLEIEARIDLHGLTQAQAHAALSAFLHRCWHDHKRCVLVITGKGREDRAADRWGVLRQAVPQWLKEPSLRHMVLALQHAQPRDGGGGALYLLLKRRRDRPG